MKETEFNGTQEPKEESIDVKELLFKYLLHWPWFVGAVVVCLITAWVYLYIATPVYNISATVLIKDDKKGGSAGMLSGLESLGLDGLMSSSQNIDNEIEVLRSKTIVKEVVEDLGLYISYTDEDEFLSRNMYKNFTSTSEHDSAGGRFIGETDNCGDDIATTRKSGCECEDR